MSSLEVARWVALWVVELSEFDIQYRPRTAIKGQIIVDFITVFTLVKGRGQKRAHGGASTQKDPLTAKQVELVWYSTA